MNNFINEATGYYSEPLITFCLSYKTFHKTYFDLILFFVEVCAKIERQGLEQITKEEAKTYLAIRTCLALSFRLGERIDLLNK